MLGSGARRTLSPMPITTWRWSPICTASMGMPPSLDQPPGAVLSGSWIHRSLGHFRRTPPPSMRAKRHAHDQRQAGQVAPLEGAGASENGASIGLGDPHRPMRPRAGGLVFGHQQRRGEVAAARSSSTVLVDPVSGTASRFRSGQAGDRGFPRALQGQDMVK